MTTIDTTMKMIQCLDPKASLELSRFTEKWYVDARVHISDGCMLSGITEHRESVEDALDAFLGRLIEVTWASDTRLVVDWGGERRHFYWNGAGFASEPVSWFTGE